MASFRSHEFEGTGFNLPDSNLTELTHYELLGVSVAASASEIRQAYRELSRQYHPDKTHLPLSIATRRFQILNEAYATLSNPERRLHYDRTIGYSSISVVRSIPTLHQPPFHQSPASPAVPRQNPHTKFDPKFSAYLDPEDRPLSSGELFALCLMGVTFVGCMALAVLLSVMKS